jgi:hypothetical protein
LEIKRAEFNTTTKSVKNILRELLDMVNQRHPSQHIHLMQPNNLLFSTDTPIFEDIYHTQPNNLPFRKYTQGALDMVDPPHPSEHIQLLQHNNLLFSTDTPEDQKIRRSSNLSQYIDMLGRMCRVKLRSPDVSNTA